MGRRPCGALFSSLSPGCLGAVAAADAAAAAIAVAAAAAVVLLCLLWLLLLWLCCYCCCCWHGDPGSSADTLGPSGLESERTPAPLGDLGELLLPCPSLRLVQRLRRGQAPPGGGDSVTIQGTQEQPHPPGFQLYQQKLVKKAGNSK